MALIYVSGVLGTLAVLLLSRVIKWLPVISYIGRYSIIVLCTHMPIMKALILAVSLLPAGSTPALWSSNAVQSMAFLLLTLACSMACCWFLSKYLPWFTAQKDLIRAEP